MSDARCVLWMPDVNSFCVRCQILCGWMPDVSSFCVRCLDNHCCTAGCQKLAGWPSVCKIKPRSSSDVFLCLLLTVILAEAKDLLYGLLCLQGIRWLSTCEMSVGMVFKERSIFWIFFFVGCTRQRVFQPRVFAQQSCQQLATDTHFSCLIWPTCTWNATSCSWLCISIIIVQLTELFCRYSSSRLWQRSPCLAAVSFHIPSISWQAWHVWCLFLWPLRLLWLTSWCNWIGYLVIFVAAPLLCTSGFGFAVIMAVMKVMKKPASLKPPKKRLGKAVLRCSVHHAHYRFGIPFLGFTGKSTVTLSLPDVLLPKLKKYKTLSKQRRLSWIDSGVSQ